jgi:hypothetical protein
MYEVAVEYRPVHTRERCIYVAPVGRSLLRLN